MDDYFKQKRAANKSGLRELMKKTKSLQLNVKYGSNGTMDSKFRISLHMISLYLLSVGLVEMLVLIIFTRIMSFLQRCAGVK